MQIFIQKQMFHPTLFGVFINPFYFTRRELHRHIQSFAQKIKGKVLDIGCGSKPYRYLFRVNRYIGIDLKKSGHNHSTSNIDIFYDGKHIPFPKNHFSSVVMFEVLEHVFNPDELLKEIRRVIKTHGTILLSVPCMWDEHEKPFDYGRYTSYGMKYLLEKHGFTVLKQVKSTVGSDALFQLINSYVYKCIIKKGTKYEIFCMTIITGIFNCIGLVCGFCFPKHTDFYLDNIFLARKK
jgi:SAM-dependent methyltransferase